MLPVPTLLANGINPVLTAMLLPAPFLPAPFLPPRRTSPGEYWLRCALSIGLALALALAESGKHFEVWRGHSEFPSGHESFGLAAASCLILRDLRWSALALPLVLLLAWALVAARYHHPVDIAGAFLIGPPCALLCHHLKLPRR